MEKPKYSEENLSYLSGQGDDAPQKEDIKSVIRPLEYSELPGEAIDETGLAENIKKSENLETKSDEFVILERKVSSELSGFDFYLARRQKPGKTFKPETVLVAKRNKKHYVQKLKKEISKKYDILDEQRKLLTENENILVERAGKDTETSSGSYFITQGDGYGDESLGEGGFAKVIPAVLRKKGKFTPEAVVIKKTHHIRKEDEYLSSEAEVISVLKQLKSISPGSWEYLTEPVDSVEGDEHSGVWELISSSEDKNFKVEDLKDRLEKGEKIPIEKKLVIIRQIFEALSQTDKLGILHNDIKPANILLTKNGIKICDFGLMHFSKKMMDPKFTKTATKLPDTFHGMKPRKGVITGSPLYIHPRRFSFELSGKERERDNPRYDIYSAVITAAQIITDGEMEKAKFKGRDTYDFFSNYNRYINEIKKLLREKFTQQVDKSSIDKEKATQFLELLIKGTTPSLGKEYDDMGFNIEYKDLSDEAKKERKTPIDQILPSPSDFVNLLKEMGIKKDF